MAKCFLLCVKSGLNTTLAGASSALAVGATGTALSGTPDTCTRTAVPLAVFSALAVRTTATVLCIVRRGIQKRNQPWEPPN